MLYPPNNFRGEKPNVFSAISSINMVCVPEEMGAKVSGCDEVVDLRMDSEMYEREYNRFRRIYAKNSDDKTLALQLAHYCNLTRRHDKTHELLSKYGDDPAAKTLLGMVSLQRGEMRWDAYEARYQQPNTFGFGGHRKPAVRHWRGEKTDEVVFIWNEQGFGDSMMFGRFIAEALKRAPNLIVDIQPQLYELFEVSDVVPDGQLFRMGRTLP